MLAAARLRVKNATSAAAAIVSDSFNRANSTTTLGTADTGQAWTALTNVWGITSNTAYLVTTGGSQSFAVVDAGVADCSVQVTLSGSFANGGGLTWRATNSSNLWFIDSDSTGSSVYKVVAGAFTNVQSAITTFVAGDILKIVLSGSTIKVYKNGTQVGTTITDSFNSTATKHGLRDYNGNLRFDNFSVS